MLVNSLQKHCTDPCFTPFIQNIANMDLPERFTFPFYYQPHSLSLIAVAELQDYLKKYLPDEFTQIGKMFGILLVENQAGAVGYLSAVSGAVVSSFIVENKMTSKFVPPVFDVKAKENNFQLEQKTINALNERINDVEKDSGAQQQIKHLTVQLAHVRQQAENEIQAQQQCVIENRKTRKRKRADFIHLTPNEQQAESEKALSIQLSRESVADKKRLLEVKQHWQEKILTISEPLDHLLAEIAELKNKRKALSAALQQKIFQQYQFLNINGEQKNLTQLFSNTSYHAVHHAPPAGAGECAAPKLLQYAFKQGYKPLALAEFWWGKSPKSEVREHKNFYGACIGKCQPILAHMLSGIMVDEDPLLTNTAENMPLEIIYQDDVMVVVNKPSELLSVPGKSIKDSVYQRVQQLFPNATGSLIVHRLDMSTSGLMVLALNPQVHKNLQKQFIERTVKKRYLALLDGLLAQDEGTINLPLLGDFNDRPRQMVCYQEGKVAETFWQVISINKQQQTTKVALYPKTGRTHQLRVHCAHALGLHMPIIGDDLYGKNANRLHLQAQYLAFDHPVSNKPLVFEIPDDF